jgi:L-fucose mutarotase/ribose pyranase (RbsD/FucU family)
VDGDVNNIRLVDAGVYDLEVATQYLLGFDVPVKDLTVVVCVIELDAFVPMVCDRQFGTSKDEIHEIGHEVAEDSATRTNIVLVVGIEFYRDIDWFSNTAAWVVNMHEGT